ncbi:hypothetical protein BJ508DRAFT_330476 [Ascobolus immersus RN42]|uniref:Uncharacterized protein n=1 Tax=Ascobolus immersus RN42 TaxID=1160509 RepID=A0A3N4HXD9_ASCIM|nr:hypothetical protein BJ508DRAFT_330476 [Ascobolus immersus RN42]
MAPSKDNSRPERRQFSQGYNMTSLETALKEGPINFGPAGAMQASRRQSPYQLVPKRLTFEQRLKAVVRARKNAARSRDREVSDEYEADIEDLSPVDDGTVARWKPRYLNYQAAQKTQRDITKKIKRSRKERSRTGSKKQSPSVEQDSVSSCQGQQVSRRLVPSREHMFLIIAPVDVLDPFASFLGRFANFTGVQELQTIAVALFQYEEPKLVGEEIPWESSQIRVQRITGAMRCRPKIRGFGSGSEGRSPRRTIGESKQKPVRILACWREAKKKAAREFRDEFMQLFNIWFDRWRNEHEDQTGRMKLQWEDVPVRCIIADEGWEKQLDDLQMVEHF